MKEEEGEESSKVLDFLQEKTYKLKVYFHSFIFFKKKIITFFFSYAPKNPILSLDFLEQKMVKLELSPQFLQAKLEPNLSLLLLNYFQRQE